MTSAVIEPRTQAPSPVVDGGPDYSGSDIRSYRNALSLRFEELNALLAIDGDHQWEREAGQRSTGTFVMLELLLMEQFVEDLTRAEIAAVLADAPEPAAVVGGRVVLEALETQDEFQAAYPRAVTRRDGFAYPVSLQQVAAGRAAAELSRRGYNVEVYRTDGRRGDLRVRRLAAGLLKKETADLLGSNAKKYDMVERGKSAAPSGMIAELQAVDDFIEQAAARLPVTSTDDADVVFMTDDFREFQRAFPQARTRRDGRAYPSRVLAIAAVRRARAMMADSGRPIRIHSVSQSN
ncbi:Uncharacterised protein [Mycobacteroides abscessus subsp. bolletii]|nr:Uncharacterised protein [Mycobacteroides abscessus subsp. bolletii]